MAAGNHDYGYLAGGEPPVTTVIDRIDYSNDTPTATQRGNLNTSRYGGAGTGNIDFGYFAGGQAPSPVLSSIDRLDYSNDTSTASPKGPLTAIGYGLVGWSGGMNGLPQFGG